MILKPTFQSWKCTQQRVLLRADLNIPLRNGSIIGEQRLRAIQPTLDYLLSKNTQVILATHIGRPEGYEAALSTNQLLPWFATHNYAIEFAPSLDAVATMSFIPKSIILLENLRFFPEEKKGNLHFAQKLARLAPWYVNDAFGTLHRADTSITLLAYQYPKDHRSIGFLIEKELAILTSLMHNPVHPVCFIVGGGKVSDKLPFLKHLCGFANIIVVCPALVFTFLKALGKPVGKSLVDHEAIDQIPALITAAQNSNTLLVFPSDYQIARHDKNGPLSYIDTDQFPHDSIGISIGPKSIAYISGIIKTSGTVFYNGMMGFEDRQDTLEGIKAILTAMSQSTATTLVAGGDSIAIADQLHLQGITHRLTGGGATLAYLSNQPLPGLDPFLKDGTKTN